MRFKGRIMKDRLQVLIGVSMACEKIGRKGSIMFDSEFVRGGVTEIHELETKNIRSATMQRNTRQGPVANPYTRSC